MTQKKISDDPKLNDIICELEKKETLVRKEVSRGTLTVTQEFFTLSVPYFVGENGCYLARMGGGLGAFQIMPPHPNGPGSEMTEKRVRSLTDTFFGKGRDCLVNIDQVATKLYEQHQPSSRPNPLNAFETKGTIYKMELQ